MFSRFAFPFVFTSRRLSAAVSVFAISFLLTGLGAQPAVQESLQEPWPFELSDLEADPAVTWGELENGVRFAIMPNAEPRERVSLRLFIGAGSLHEKEDQRGLAHFLEHMGFNGTENFGPGTLIEYFQRLGMAFGADTNAYTSFDRTVYMIELPDPALSAIDEGLLVLRDYAGRMLLEEEQVEAERNVVLSEMRTRDSVGYRTALSEFEFLLPESIIPHRFPIGTAEVLQNATREDLLDYYHAWYRPANTVLVIVGEVEPEDVAELVEKHFANFEAPGPVRQKPDLGKVVAEGVQIRLHTEMEAPSTRVSIQTVMPYDPQPDTLETRIARMQRSAAMQMLSRRLDTLSRQEDAPFSRGSAGAFEMFEFVTNASIELTCEPEQWKGALRVAEQELRRVLLHGFQESELAEVKATMLNAYEESVRRAETRRSSGLAESIIRSLSANQVFTSPETELELMRPQIEAMTVEDALRAFRETWSPAGRFVFVAGNLSLENAEEQIRKVYEISRNELVEPMEELSAAEFAYTDFGTKGEIAEHRHVEDLDLHQVRFENGVRLNLKRTEFQANTIHVQARVGNGKLIEPEDQQGVAMLASLTFIQGGLGEHSSDELRRIFAGRNVGVGFNVVEDAFLFAGATTPADLLLQLQLMAAHITDPGYRPEALRLARNDLREIYRQSRHTAEGVLRADVTRFLAGGDHRFGYPPEEQVAALELADVENWLRDPLRTGYLEISLVGDLDVEETISAVAATFGALPERETEKPDLAQLRRVDFPEGETEREFRFQSEIPRGFSLVYWPTDDMWDIEQTRRLQVLARIFSDRMRIRIREEMGDAYSPYATSQPSDTYEGFGLFYGVVGIDPERAREVAEVVLEIAADLHENGATLDELERALKPIVTSLATTIRDNGYWMNSVLASPQEHPERLDWARQMVEDYASITTEDVTELAEKYLNPDQALRVFVLPE